MSLCCTSFFGAGEDFRLLFVVVLVVVGTGNRGHSAEEILFIRCRDTPGLGELMHAC